MSNIFQVYARTTGGIVPLSIGADPLIDPIKSQGLNVNDEGEIYATTSEAIDHHNQGLPFDANGRLVVDYDDISYYSMGVPFTVAGAVAIGGDVFRYDQGVGFTEDGFLATGLSPFENLYFNPEMAGGTDFVAGVGTFPDFHVASNNDNTIDATYNGEGAEPSYTFNPNNNTGRLAFRQIRSTTGDLIAGHRYRFSAEVWIDGYDGSSTEMLRGVNINNNAAIIINRDNADHSGTNGEWDYCEVFMDVIGTSSTIYLAHGCGVINASDITSEYRNIALNDLGAAPATVIDQPLSDLSVSPGATKSIPSTWALAVRYQWFFDDDTGNFRAISDGQTYQGTETDTLAIQSMSAATEGRYICVGFNMDDERTDSEVAIIRMPTDFDSNDFLNGDFSV